MKPVQPRASADVVAQWWINYTKSRELETRNKLWEHYLPLVRYTAERLRTKLPDEVDVEDLFSNGIMGLKDAVDSFDLARGVKFETYCVPRIRGAILDYLRAMDWVPRLVRSRAHRLNDARQTLEAQLGRKPNEKELAERMRISLKEFRKLQRDAHACSMISLNKKWYETDSYKEVREGDMIEDRKSEDPFLHAQKKDLKELITRGLSRAERLIVLLYYFEEMTMKEIGETLDLSESRVSQMHSAILERLRHHLEKRGKELQTV